MPAKSTPASLGTATSAVDNVLSYLRAHGKLIARCHSELGIPLEDCFCAAVREAVSKTGDKALPLPGPSRPCAGTGNGKAISTNLRAFRGNASQAEFSKRVGVSSQQSYQRYESGARIPNAIVLHRIASRLGVSVDSLLTEQESQAADAEESCGPGDLIKKARMGLGLSQAHAARRLGITADHFSRLERGAYPCGRRMVIRFCKEFGVPESSFEPNCGGGRA